ncbi:hypothetical protein CgunFtcFv8_008000 [Champsocephalus gunnari]|uniref:Uncharacterized protein n=1 Tax=Champsocephalus gunnari TaxID=52237 RepID=A0AAN8CZJ8_CHAGU|nr:hypothetical protein CgunFtcFv8_008000 [Champsocephalus gunnari]
MPAGMKPLEKFLKKQTTALTRAGGFVGGVADKASGGTGASRRRASLSRVVPFFRETSPESGQAREVFSPDSEDPPLLALCHWAQSGVGTRLRLWGRPQPVSVQRRAELRGQPHHRVCRGRRRGDTSSCRHTGQPYPRSAGQRGGKTIRSLHR